MTRSTFIPTMLAAFCCLGLQFQASGANAQGCCLFGTFNGINANYTTPGLSMYAGSSFVSPYSGTHLTMQSDGNLVLYSWEGVALWSTQVTWGDYGDFLIFGTSGDLQVNTVVNEFPYPPIYNIQWDSGTYVGGRNNWSGSPGYYLAVQDNGDLAIYDQYYDMLWAASWDPQYNWGEAYNVQQYCGC
jgi:hypothetical protein